MERGRVHRLLRTGWLLWLALLDRAIWRRRLCRRRSTWTGLPVLTGAVPRAGLSGLTLLAGAAIWLLRAALLQVVLPLTRLTLTRLTLVRPALTRLIRRVALVVAVQVRIGAA